MVAWRADVVQWNEADHVALDGRLEGPCIDRGTV